MIHLVPSGCEYVNIPKCGSQSIRAALGIKDGDKYSGNRRRIGGVITLPWDRSKYVAVVRDPLARFVSCIAFLNRNYGLDFCYETWIAMDGKYPHKRMGHHLRPQIDFIQDPSKFHKLYDISEMDQFFKDHGLGPMRRENVTTTKKMPINDQVIEWVNFKYREDYERLGQWFKASDRSP